MSTQSKPRKFIIDTDTASDDAVALLMALAYPGVSVEAITVVSGNVPLHQASINARYTLEIAGESTPVYEGCDRPLVRDAAHAQWFHGSDGMGNMNYPPPCKKAEPNHAIDELIQRFTTQKGEMTLVTLGPLTNIATALKREPSMAHCVQHCYIMGGAACTVGNVTPAAEYNIWCDPEAAHIVFHSGMPITMIGWELSRSPATLSNDEIADIRNMGTTKAKFAMDCNEYAHRAVMQIQGESGLALADPVAMTIALDERCCTAQSKHFVTISCDEEITRGMTVVDQLNITARDPNVSVCWSLDEQRWKALLMESLQ